MIQRIQSIYLLFAGIVSCGLIFAFSLWTTDETEVFAVDVLPAFIIFLLSGLLTIVSIFNYKNRKNQFVLGRLNILLNLFLLGFFVYRSLNLS